ncbi:MAG TPA: amino acid adenylation domain-containing protein [Steroidobacter sp.]|uniref:amino acid adenylation domain-containing protein n=1 Tax=Steroidobacter sp. TaxID=1978227 RepID=UPI002EDBB1C5
MHSPGTSPVIHLAFDEQTSRSAQRTALKYENRSLTYAQLNKRANHLAAHLQSHAAVKRGDIVAVKIARCPEQIVALLAILKCGAAYLPLDENDPVARAQHCLEEAGVRVILADRLDDSRVRGDRLCITLEQRTLFEEEREFAPMVPVSGEDPCYVMFTSGSTGAPKGVVVPHRAVIRLVQGTNYIAIAESDRILQFAPISFDASTFEIWGALLNGAGLVLYPGATLDPNLLVRQIREHEVTILWLTAALFHLIATRYTVALRTVKVVLAGGDVLQPKLVNKVLDEVPGITLINGYGPTENTTFTCCHRMTVANRPTGCVPIGKAITGTCLHVLDSARRPVANGESGELFVSGAGVALGYLNDDGHDGGAFFADAGIASGLIYRTGDLVRVNEAGELEFEGRVDNQVKVRGFRVSLEEIQANILKLPQIADAVVVLQKFDSGDQQLVAYLQLTAPQSISVAEIRQALATDLPRYMIPDRIHLDVELPINRNGKLDRARIGSAAAPAG